MDKQAPVVTRAYKEEALKIVTNEDAECAFSPTSCNFVFADGLKMQYSNANAKMNHYADWEDNKAYYIKCKDFYGNEPSPNECSIVIRSIELTSEKNV